MPRPHRPKLRLALLATATLLLLFSIAIWIAGFLPKTPTLGWHDNPGTLDEVRGYEITAIAGRLFFIRQTGSPGDFDPQTQRFVFKLPEQFGGGSPKESWSAVLALVDPDHSNGLSLPGLLSASVTWRWQSINPTGSPPAVTLQMSFDAFSIHAAYGIALSALLFAWLYLPRLRRPPPHACPHCHYDLRATPDPLGPLLPTCPECGHAATPLSSPA